jgi:hypothetical protein
VSRGGAGRGGARRGGAGRGGAGRGGAGRGGAGRGGAGWGGLGQGVCAAAPAGRDTTRNRQLRSSRRARTPGIRARAGVSRNKSIAVELPDFNSSD